MTKKEVIWREILYQFRKNQKDVFTQKELAAEFGFSLSTVFNALKIPRAAHIVTVSGRNFCLDSYEKFLYLWASHRALRREIVDSFAVELSSKEIESQMPPRVTFGLYSAVVLGLGAAPADYDHIYVYSEPEEIPAIKERFKNAGRRRSPNVFILKKDPWLSWREEMPVEQIFADIWSAPEWYAKDFLTFLKTKLPLNA